MSDRDDRDRSGRAFILRLRDTEVIITISRATGDESGKDGRPPHEQLLLFAEKLDAMKDLSEERAKEYIGGSVSWADRGVPMVIGWRSGQVNLGFQHKEAVGKNWSVHETLRDLKSMAFCDTLEMWTAMARLNEAVARFAEDHWEQTEEIQTGCTIGDIVTGRLPGVCAQMRQVLKKREELLFAGGRAKTDEELLARGDDGAAAFQERIERDRSDAEAWFALGCRGGGRVDGKKYGAKACYEQALQHKPDHVDAWYNLGIEGGGRVSDKAYSGKQCYEQALQHKPDDADAWYSLGVEGGGSVSDKAYSKKECYEQALQHKPDHAIAWYNLGVRGGGRVSDKAYSRKECYEQALQHKPDLSDAWYNLGNRGGGRVSDKAYSRKKCYEQALQHKPDDADAWFSLGKQGGGRVSDKVYNEKECYELALQHRPGFANAKQALDLLA